jgi:hypothetical protein
LRTEETGNWLGRCRSDQIELSLQAFSADDFQFVVIGRQVHDFAASKANIAEQRETSACSYGGNGLPASATVSYSRRFTEFTSIGCCARSEPFQSPAMSE